MLKKSCAIIASVILAATLVFTGCSESDNSTSQTASASSVSQDSGSPDGSDISGITKVSSDKNDLYTERDLQQTADTSSAKSVTVSDGQTIDITEEGVYVISGTAKNCTVKVNAPDNAKVQLVLDGVSITNDDFPAIYVVSADKCFVTTTDKQSTLSVSGSFRSDGDTNTDAVIFSKDDLVFNGTGTLVISSANGNGISGKDDIKVTGGTYEITSKLDSIEANDRILICAGTFTVNSEKDALHCENDEDKTLGIIVISDGTFKITAKSDAIQGNTAVTVDGGSFELKAAEGIESTLITINGGKLNITSTDDGINAGNKNKSNSTPTIEINGGDIKITMADGDTDGIDSNGDIIVNGGTVDITTSGSSFDYDGTASYNGGTIIINGNQTDNIPQSMMGGRGGMRGGMKGGMRGEMPQDMRDQMQA